MILYLGTFFQYPLGQVSKAPIPNWVNAIAYSTETSLEEDELWGGIVYLMYDRQVHVEKKTTYTRVAVEFTNGEGVEEFSEISVNYDPSYQKVVFHKINILRGGKEIDKLNSQVIQTLQRETDMERHIYDGSETALVSLSDVRVGDILEYGFSVEGRNPIYEGKFYGTWYAAMYYPVSELHLQFITRPDRKLQFKGHPEPMEMETENSNGARIYSYHQSNVILPEWEANIPGWLNLVPRLEVTEMGSWGEVTRWAVRHFKISKADEKAVAKLLATMPEDRHSSYEHGTDYTKWVQNEVRYLGLESGIGGYRPRAPAKVIKDRFGDCKDKSLLLSTMLRQKGIQAWPMLVLSTGGLKLPDHLPNPLVFDHCVVYVEGDNETFVVDPTIKMQGGLFTEMFAPNYEYGLVIRPGETGLTPVKGNGVYFVHVNSMVDVGGGGDTAELLVETKYVGGAADETRQIINELGQKEWGKNCIQFYRRFFEEVEAEADIEVEFTDTLGKNTATVIERYKIADYWKPGEGENQELWTAEFVPFEMIDYLHLNSISGRTLPYALRYPLRFKQTLMIKSDEFVPMDPYRDRIRGPGFNFSVSNHIQGRRNIIDFEYEETRRFIEADSVAEFYEKQEKASEDLTFYIQLGDTEKIAAQEGNWTWLKILFILLAFAGLGFAYWKWAYSYDPAPKVPLSQSLQIGSWLWLPIIGLCLGILASMVQFLGFDMLFAESVLRALFDSDYAYYDQTFGVYGLIESLILVGLMVLMIGNLILIAQRRTSVPRMMAIMYSSKFVFALVTLASVTYFEGHGYTFPGWPKSAWVGALFGVGLWMPLFLVSARSKETFTVTRKSRSKSQAPTASGLHEPPPLPPQTPPPLPSQNTSVPASEEQLNSDQEAETQEEE